MEEQTITEERMRNVVFNVRPSPLIGKFLNTDNIHKLFVLLSFIGSICGFVILTAPEQYGIEILYNDQQTVDKDTIKQGMYFFNFAVFCYSILGILGRNTNTTEFLLMFLLFNVGAPFYSIFSVMGILHNLRLVSKQTRQILNLNKIDSSVAPINEDQLHYRIINILFITFLISICIAVNGVQYYQQRYKEKLFRFRQRLRSLRNPRPEIQQSSTSGQTVVNSEQKSLISPESSSIQPGT